MSVLTCTTHLCYRLRDGDSLWCTPCGEQAAKLEAEQAARDAELRERVLAHLAVLGHGVGVGRLQADLDVSAGDIMTALRQLHRLERVARLGVTGWRITEAGRGELVKRGLLEGARFRGKSAEVAGQLVRSLAGPHWTPETPYLVCFPTLGDHAGGIELEVYAATAAEAVERAARRVDFQSADVVNASAQVPTVVHRHRRTWEGTVEAVVAVEYSADLVGRASA